MQIRSATQEARTDFLAVIAPVPPPVTGRTVVTARIIDELDRCGVPYWLLNTAVRTAGSPLRRKLRRARRLALYAFQLFRERRRAATAYIPVDATPGTLFTALYVSAAKLAGARIVLHHHSYSYVSRPTLAMRGLCWFVGRDALHVTPCAMMSAEFGARYLHAERIVVLTNACAIDPGLRAVRRRAAKRDRLVLGHLSNLTVAKGVLTVIACFAELRRRGEPVELHLAGPIQDETVERAIRHAGVEYGEAFHHHGPLDAAGKHAFYEGIDVFLFPTQFRNEVQPLVVLEALATGVPTVAFGRACIPPLLEGVAGVVVPCDADFTSAAVARIVAWRSDRAALAAAGEAARARFEQLHRRSLDELGLLLGELTNGPQGQRSPPAPSFERSRVNPILFVGPLPPPVTGRTVVTACIERKLTAEGVPLVVANTAPKQRRPHRLGRFAASFITAVTARMRGASSAYVVVDAGLGMYHTMAIAGLARLLGLEIFLHHHVYSYIRTRKPRMALLCEIAGSRVNHVMLSQRMIQEFKKHYPDQGNAIVVGNFGFVEGGSRPHERKEKRALRIGHLSNLRIDKGLGRVRATAEVLAAKGVPHEIWLAGPTSTPAARDAVATWPESAHSRLRYLGPVYDAQKAAFFEEIDAFLFPSLYDNEAAPLVCIEALAAGVPVIAFDVACIAEVIANGGVALPRDNDFAEAAASILAEWAQDDALLAAFSERARRAYLYGLGESERELQGLIRRLWPPLGPEVKCGVDKCHQAAEDACRSSPPPAGA